MRRATARRRRYQQMHKRSPLGRIKARSIPLQSARATACLPLPDACSFLISRGGQRDPTAKAMPAVAAHRPSTLACPRCRWSCPAGAAAVWKLLPAVEKVVLPFSLSRGSQPAEWANLLGAVREPDFQACIIWLRFGPSNLLPPSPTAPPGLPDSGFSATSQLTPQAAQAASCGWPNQAAGSLAQPNRGCPCRPTPSGLRLPKSDLDAATASLPPGPGPLCCWPPTQRPQPVAGPGPRPHWQAFRSRSARNCLDLRVEARPSGGSPAQQARPAWLSAMLVPAASPASGELALLTGHPLVALGRSGDSCPRARGYKGVGGPVPSISSGSPRCSKPSGSR